MACTATYADAGDFFSYWNMELPDEYESDLNRLLEMAASNINIALMSAGACDCDFSAHAVQYLVQLNCLLAAILYQNPCGPQLKPEERRMYLDWSTEQLAQIRDGRLELCDGHTGSEYPSVGWAEQALTEFAAVEIIRNRELRESG